MEHNNNNNNIQQEESVPVKLSLEDQYRILDDPDITL